MEAQYCDQPWNSGSIFLDAKHARRDTNKLAQLELSHSCRKDAYDRISACVDGMARTSWPAYDVEACVPAPS